MIPINPRYHDAIACHSCLRNGRVSLTHDTVYGMVRYEDAVAGITHGTPMGEHGEFATSLNSDGWTQVHVPQKWLLELTRTPPYLTMQSEVWEFCCARPMVYIGEWIKADFDAHSPDGMGQRYFEDVVREAEPGLWDAMWSGGMHDEFAIYMFYCPVCANYRGHWDMF
ncbi:MAG: CbrC family protein [Fibrella sp.]|nr:CbrC family protein [Armatimonadota bacterium]